MKIGKDRGFTLLEVILVLVIISGTGFLLAVKLPLHLESRRLEMATTQLLYDLRDTEQAAKSENVWYQVNFYPHDGCYQILRQGVWVKDVPLQEGIKISNGPANIIFNSSGIPYPGTRIVLRDAAGEERKVFVAPVAGRIREE